MQIRQITAHPIIHYDLKQAPLIDSAPTEWRNNPYVQKHYFAFTTLRYNSQDGLLYCGVTNFGNDILYRFDLKTKRFESMEYFKAPFAEKYDIKLHRSIELAKDGTLYGATSCLHDVDERKAGVGGKVFRFDPKTRAYTLLAIPKEHDYIQTITLDEPRDMIYGFTYPVFEFFAYSLGQNQILFRNYMASISHISAVDDAGCFWGTWGQGRHHLFKYDPSRNDVTYFKHGFPEKCRSLMYPGAGPIDCMVNGRDGFLYVATENATLYRLNPKDGAVEFLGKPFPGTRMPGLILGDDGLLYGSGGDDNECIAFTYDRSRRTFASLGKIQGGERKVPCFRSHDIAKIGNTLFVAETDNPTGTSFLWECTLG